MKSIILSLFSLAIILAPNFSQPVHAQQSLNGRILLQVEDRGEAWWVNPSTGKRHFMYRAQNAYDLMRRYGVGITNSDLEKIPIGYFQMTGADADADGLSDAMENAIGSDPNNPDTDGDSFLDSNEILQGFDPNGSGSPATDLSFTRKNLGKIFLQVEDRGEAWWVNPADEKRYFLGRAEDAYEIMRSFGLGITNADLAQIPITESLMQCGEGEGSDECFLTSLRLRQPVDTVRMVSLNLGNVEITTRQALTYYSGGHTESGIVIQTEHVYTEPNINAERREELRNMGYSEEEIRRESRAEMESLGFFTMRNAGKSDCTYVDLEAFQREYELYDEGILNFSAEIGGTAKSYDNDGSLLSECTMFYSDND